MGCQVIQAIGQASGEPSLAFAENHYVEKLLLHRQVFLQLDDERRPGEEVAQEQAEETMPVHAGILQRGIGPGPFGQWVGGSGSVAGALSLYAWRPLWASPHPRRSWPVFATPPPNPS